ncbi:hypothetical protein B0H63DRAFT_447411 [Podospora didyma]|uniref:BTB domain-containing protein n=1 Tax=Podospora didyma TaxID=330526 RepID=A0AAE0NRN2_9PEZI|nr:hypothetical protein B0H63DRAFT_447411 [Podospora didyma]
MPLCNLHGLGRLMAILAAVIKEPFGEGKTGVITMHDCKPSTAAHLVEWLYTGIYGHSSLSQVCTDIDPSFSVSVTPAALDLADRMRVSAIADYYIIKPLAKAAQTRFKWHLNSSELKPETLLAAAAEYYSIGNVDPVLQDMLVDAIASNIVRLIEMDQLDDRYRGIW